MAETLHVIAMMRAREGRENDLKELLESLIDPTRAEEGCLDYRLMQDREDPRRFVFVEEWRSPDDLEAHFETPHLQGGREKFSELVEGDLKIRRLKLVG